MPASFAEGQPPLERSALLRRPPSAGGSRRPPFLRSAAPSNIAGISGRRPSSLRPSEDSSPADPLQRPAGAGCFLACTAAPAPRGLLRWRIGLDPWQAALFSGPSEGSSPADPLQRSTGTCLLLNLHRDSGTPRPAWATDRPGRSRPNTGSSGAASSGPVGQHPPTPFRWAPFCGVRSRGLGNFRGPF